MRVSIDVKSRVEDSFLTVTGPHSASSLIISRVTWKADKKLPSWIFSLDPAISLTSISANLMRICILTWPGSSRRWM